MAKKKKGFRHEESWLGTWPRQQTRRKKKKGGVYLSKQETTSILNYVPMSSAQKAGTKIAPKVEAAKWNKTRTETSDGLEMNSISVMLKTRMLRVHPLVCE